jgi:hypothetical protein
MIMIEKHTIDSEKMITTEDDRKRKRETTIMVSDDHGGDYDNGETIARSNVRTALDPTALPANGSHDRGENYFLRKISP